MYLGLVEQIYKSWHYICKYSANSCKSALPTPNTYLLITIYITRITIIGKKYEKNLPID